MPKSIDTRSILTRYVQLAAAGGGVSTHAYQVPRPGFIVGIGMTVYNTGVAQGSATDGWLSKRVLVSTEVQSGDDIYFLISTIVTSDAAPAGHLSTANSLYSPLRIRMQAQQIVYCQVLVTAENGALQAFIQFLPDE